MKKKLVLKVKEPLNENIVAITHCNSCNIDENFYVEKMDEITEENHKNASEF